MLYAETGRYPLEIITKCRTIGFWINLVIGNTNKLSYKLYKFMLDLPEFSSKWLNNVQNILQSTGQNEAWLYQTNINKSLKYRVKQILIDQHAQTWNKSLQQSNKARNYSIYKDKIQLEPYLLDLCKLDALTLLKFRTGNHYLPIETGRWEGIDISDRRCNLCRQVNEVGDEYHYLFKCSFFNVHRPKYIKRYYIHNPNILKYQQLMQSRSQNELFKLSKFIKIVIGEFKR
jgi:hypothetical protein